MAGNIQADNSGNILVEFDYQNIIVVDPNKTIDEFGKIQERLVDHEKLVMYANLEAEVLPRTKLAVGGAPNDSARTISVAKINFLRPNDGKAFTTGYLDEITGEGSLEGKGVNQIIETTLTDSKNKPYVKQTIKPENANDNGLLGITQINITTNSSFVPSVKIELEDVQGRALFQLGNNSPYSAFFNLPYPQFYLTLKGYYGQAVRYQLNLEKFNARFNSFSGNYQVSLEFRGYKFNILNEIAMGHLLALPHMYGTRFDVTTAPVQSQQSQSSALSSGGNNIIQNQGLATSNSEGVTQIIAKKGYQKIVEVYSEYKSKGLIAPDFPELTLVQLMNKLELLEKNIVDSFPKVEVEPLTNIRTYKQFLKQYFDNIRGESFSWFNKYLNPRPIILKNESKRVYVFKSELDLEKRDSAVSDLKKNIDEYNKVLLGNATLGITGPSPIPNSIKYDTIAIPAPSFNDIDWIATTRFQTGIVQPTTAQTQVIISQYKPLLRVSEIAQTPEKLLVEERPKFFIFEGDGRFDRLITVMEADANKKLAEYEAAISDKLLEKLSDAATGIGFRPTVRNLLAVIMASAEGFIRLLDEVHTNAWNVKYDPVRKNAILTNVNSAPGSDTVDYVRLSEQAFNQQTGLKFSEIPVYPWPQFFVETPDDKKGRFQLKYIADPTVVDITQGYLYEKWPEVEFVEEYMVGLTQKFDAPAEPPPLENDRDTNRININAIEFPNLGLAYSNKEEIKFFYEIWERQFVTARYSNFSRANQNQISDLIELNIETETNNIVNGLGVSSPFLTFKLKNIPLDSANYEDFLRNISNAGTGRAWQDFIRDFFVTPYLRNLTENSFGLLNALDLGKIPQTSAKSDALRALITTASNDPQIIDTLPFTDPSWVATNMADGIANRGTAVYNTNKTLKIFEPRKIIANFSDTYDFTTNRPVTNFSYISAENPVPNNRNIFENYGSLFSFYTTRRPKNFIPTEGICLYNVPSEQLPPQTTTSILNTPYFVNSILNGVSNNRRNDPYPYVQAAYFFLNSLPIATLKEKYKRVNGLETEDLDYIASCFKKFGAIHKLPYAWILKLGSNWHRYKKFKETGNDIISSAWKNFNYLENYSPILSSATQNYKFTYSGKDESIFLQNESATDITMDVGFYPKLISDFNYFYTGYDFYQSYTNEEIQNSINLGLKVYNLTRGNIEGARQGNKNFVMKTWSVLTPKLRVVAPSKCEVDNTKGDEYFIIPSFGTQTNQTRQACFTGQTSSLATVVDVTSNPSVFNGTVRTLWSAPNYGYFDNNQIVYPQPDSYLNFFDPSGTTQTPMSLLNVDAYSKIEEIFSVFEKRILDSFEDEFLKFSKPSTDAESTRQPAQFLQSTTDLDANFRNFQSLFTSLMTVEANVKKLDDKEYFTQTINTQFGNFKNGIDAFMEYDVIFKYGNPSNYKRRIFDSYLSYQSTQVVTDPIPFEPYQPNSLPSVSGGITLQQSQLNNRQAWIALETEVGFSTIPNVTYSSNGSYITDFFIQNNIAFTQQNVVILAPIIKMWATQKLLTPSLTVAQFKNRLTNYLTSTDELQNNFLNNILTRVRKRLPDQQQLPERTIKSVIQGEQSKVENYEVFKALNDKWIAGEDFNNKTLFEDMLFLDRASRNIGDTIVLDIFDLKNMYNKNSLNEAMSVFTFMSGILIKNNFTVMNLPAYVNFYNIQSVDGTTIPQPEGSLEFANSMWGTFLDVDYRKSGPKMVCFYVGKPSQYLDLPKGNFRFRDDAFELRRASENPLIEDQKDKKDWAISNKCVGFNVDIGTRNQGIFYSFSVSQDAGVATSEAINTQLNLVDQYNGRNTATQNVSLYNLYKNRSYKCNVVALGNALIQPTMYFNLRHVPMFNGPYMITQVEHTIQPGNFQTSFAGVRQGIYDLPALDNILQSLNQNLLTKLEELVKVEKDKTIISATTDNNKASQVVQKSDNTPDASNSCVNNVDTSVYTDFEVTTVNKTELTPEALAKLLKEVQPAIPQTLQAIVFAITYVKSFVQNGNSGDGKFVGFNNNFANISLYNNFTPTYKDFFQKTYCCVNVKATSSVTRSEPVVSFKDAKGYVDFMVARLQPNLDRIIRQGLAKYYVCNWPKNDTISSSYFDANESQFETLINSILKGVDLAVKSKLIPDNISVDLKKESIIATPTASRNPNVPTPVPALPGNECVAPVITNISPSSGNTGTIIQIEGQFFSRTSGVTVNGTVVDKTNYTIFNDRTMRITVPQIGTGQQVSTGNVVLGSKFGNSTNLLPVQFTFDPNLPANAAASPGSYQNGANAAASQTQSNSNPQQTGPNPLVITTQTKSPLGGDEQLVVQVAPNVGVWEIQNEPNLSYSFYTVERGPNNTIRRNFISRQILKLTGFVSQDKQTFSCTRQQLIDFGFALEISKYQANEIEIKSQIALFATNPTTKKNVDQNYNFDIFVPAKTPTTQPFPASLVIVSNTNSGGLPNFSGPDIYNIRKPAGGYITLQFTCTNLIEKGAFTLTSLPDLVDQPITITNNAGTKYTNLIETSSIGRFQAGVRFKSSDYTHTFPNTSTPEPISAGVTSSIITL